MSNNIKLIVIDDIQTIVEGIATRINWNEHDITVVGTATDGMEGWELIQQLQPDIVLTDIRMPVMDGLELTRRLKDMPQCKVILLSAYADFAYAQEAIRLGAFDFIKKPFSLTDIVNIVLKAKQAVLEAKQQMFYYIELEKKLKQSLPLLRQEYLTLLLNHSTNSSYERQRWEFLSVELQPENIIVMLAEIDGFEQLRAAMTIRELELARFSLQNVLEETVLTFTKGIVFRESLGRFVIFINAAEKASAIEIAELCCQNVNRYTKHSISIGLGMNAAGLSDIKLSYQQALTALSYHFYTGGNAALSYADIQATEKKIALPMLIDSEELLFSIRSGNLHKALELLEQLNSRLDELSPLPDPSEIKSMYEELSETILNFFQYKSSSNEDSNLEAMELLVQNIKAYQHISRQDSHDMLRQIAELSYKLVEGERTFMADAIIEKAKAYIRANLHETLSVNSCAAVVHLSGSYFANLFKKATGMSVMQYVTLERIAQAKEWLLEDKPIQEIAYALGYKERRSFGEVFKRYTGLSPSEFKQAWLNNGESS